MHLWSFNTHSKNEVKYCHLILLQQQDHNQFTSQISTSDDDLEWFQMDTFHSLAHNHKRFF